MSQLRRPYSAVAVVEGGKNLRYFKDADNLFCVMVDYADADTAEARAWLTGFLDPSAVDGPHIVDLLALCRSHYNREFAAGLVT